LAEEEKVFRSYGPEGGVNPHVAAQVKFNNSPSVFAIVDEYCLEPGCGCRDVTIGFYEVVDNAFEELYFKILVDVDTWEIKDQRIFIKDLDCEAMIEEFIRDIDKSTKSRIKKRFETGKQYGGDQPRHGLDLSAYKQGESVIYAEVFNSTHYQRFTFYHGGFNYQVLDRYCINPDCTCDDVLLEFFSLDKKDDIYRAIFFVRVDLETGKHTIEEKHGHINNKRVDETYSHFMNNFCNSNEENDFVFKLLKDRYDRMKKINLTKHLTEGNGSDQGKQSPESAVSFKVGRNDPCPCGSGKKYKKCCGLS